ncbi:hypothetical protein [Proteus faecis]|uniref:hypothetical protein n=1 Tax=Proteus faecis TaxID=2050967 RepID=UPI003075C7EF
MKAKIKNIYIISFIISYIFIIKIFSLFFEIIYSPYEIKILFLFLFFTFISLLRNKSLFITYFIWFVVLNILVWFNFIDPLSSPDSIKYYKEAFGDGYYKSTSFSDIIHGHIPTIETTAGIIKTISLLLSSVNLHVVVCFNLILVIESSYFFCKLLMKRFSISNRIFTIALILLSFSPSIINQTFVLQKDIYVYSLSIFFVFYLNILFEAKKIKSKLLISLLLFFIFIVGCLVRLYYPLILISYLAFFFYNKIKVLFLMSFIAILSIYVFLLNGNIIDIFLGIASTTSTPNFIRFTNWIDYPIITLESLLITIFLSLSLLSIILNKHNKSCRHFYIILIFIGITLVSVSQNRKLVDSNFQTTSILNDNMTRKKLPFIPLLIGFIIISINSKNYSINNHYR